LTHRVSRPAGAVESRVDARPRIRIAQGLHSTPRVVATPVRMIYL
jgi:hypothetical protein